MSFERYTARPADGKLDLVLSYKILLLFPGDISLSSSEWVPLP
jgi:hypothetical protein